MVEKRDYLQRWKTSIVGMANRDAALQASQVALSDTKEAVQTTEINIKALRLQIRDEQRENERLTLLLNRAEAEVAIIDSQLSATQESRRELGQQYMLLRSAMDKTESELRSGRQEQRDVQTQLEALQKRSDRLTLERQKLDDIILENISDRANIRKGAQNIEKAILQLKQQIHAKEIQAGELHNEIARIKVDALNTSAHNRELETTLEAYEKELAEKDKLIEKYEGEIRQRHDKIEKKQIYIARLNKKFDQLTGGQEEENTGPLEATIKNLSKEILNEAKGVADKQREWIRTQTDLVEIVSDTNVQSEKLKELASTATVLSQKKLRLAGQQDTLKSDARALESKIRGLHTDLAKLNELIAKNAKVQDDLANANYTMEGEFMARLKEMELESAEMDAAIDLVKAKREEVFSEIVELEKQILLWEKKVKLEKETQEALDPEYGQPEIRGMKKEIHRMQLRLQKLKRQQESMVAEMELTIEKREMIRIGKQTALSATSKQGERTMTKASLSKAVADLKATLKAQVEDSKKLVKEITNYEEQNERLEQQLEQQQGEYNDAEERKIGVEKRIQEAYYTKQMNLETILMYQKRAQKFEEAGAGRLRISAPKDKIRAELLKEEEHYQRVKDAIARLRADHPKHENFFKKLLEFF
jgi:chromosome segregation ATPase